MAAEYPEAEWIGSPNFGLPRGTPGRYGHPIVAVVDHIAEGTAAGVRSWFNNPASEASSTYFVTLGGRVWQFVLETNIPWTNGIRFVNGYQAYKSDLAIPWIKECWDRHINPNLRTITIEHEGWTGNPMPDVQYQATLKLHHYLVTKYGIPLNREHIVGHYQIDAVNRARCPGAGFPWKRLFADLEAMMKKKEVDPQVVIECEINAWGPAWKAAEYLDQIGTPQAKSSAQRIREAVVAHKISLGLS